MKKDEELRWGDVVTRSHKKRLIRVTTTALGNARLRLGQLDALPVQVGGERRLIGGGFRRRVQTLQLTAAGLVLETVIGNLYSRKETRSVKTEELPALLEAFQISAPDIRVIIKETERHYEVAAALKCLSQLPQTQEMIGSLRLHGEHPWSTVSMNSDGFVAYNDKDSRGERRYYRFDDVNLGFVKEYSITMKDIVKAKKQLEA